MCGDMRNDALSCIQGFSSICPGWKNCEEPPSTDWGCFPLMFSPSLSTELTGVTFTGRSCFYFSLLAPAQHSGLAVKEPLTHVSLRVPFLFLCCAPPLVSITQSSSPAQTFHSQSLQSLAHFFLFLFFL